MNTRNYKDHSPEEILIEVFLKNKSEGWKGSSADLQRFQETLDKFNVVYVDDFKGGWRRKDASPLGQLFELQNGDGEHEAYILTKMEKELLDKEWADYYHSKGYNSTDHFVDKMGQRGYIIAKVKLIEICPS